jgi:hypothetical protein
VTDVLQESYLAALGSMRSTGPKALFRRAEFLAAEHGPGNDVTLDRLVERLRGGDLNDPLRKQIHLTLATWDSEADGVDWADGTDPRSSERRATIYQLLEIDSEMAPAFDDLFPRTSDETIVISDEFAPWYTAERRAEGEFYWPAYRRHLLDVRGWDPTAIADLDDATSRVVERFGDPYRTEAYQSKGLVVGYVQSGKTANFTGVLAKSIDAGYRLIIVLTGTVDLLRAQTQRRIDMELVGVENILRGIDPDDPESDDLLAGVDYQDDPAWPDRFVRHGYLPSSTGMPDIIRLTTHRFDYKRLQAGIGALEFEKEIKSKPLFDAVNLPHSSARLVIVKKNKTVLEKLVKDLRSITARLTEIPALIIDDESDQASVNTTNPKKWATDKPERTSINALISQLLTLLPRAQYLGYTATPFANVFIDPSDVEDIFPKHYIVSLDRPPGYMGVADFHDIDTEVDRAERTVANSQEKAHVRDLLAPAGTQEPKLLEALEAFVLSGALKLYREANGLGPGYFEHHTMLVHESVRTVDQGILAGEIRTLWSTAGFSTPSGMARLRHLFETDFLPVCAARSSEACPEEFSELKPFIADTITRITAGGDPVIIVNGDKDLAQEAIDFDKRSVWRVLVGGTKLSRGFTVEGLTVSYFRRKTKQADALMQMGRWFGFRNGYRDLVRLYIGRAEPDGKRTRDLYEAFEAVVRDEERFRDQLRKYATVVDGVPQLRPSEIPPLVSQHLPWLRPAAANKMFNAKLVVRRSPGTPLEPTGYPTDGKDLEQNFDAALPLMVAASEHDALVAPATDNVKRSQFDAFHGVVPHAVLLDALRAFRWCRSDYFTADLAYYEELVGQVEDWVVILPQRSRGLRRHLRGVGERSLFSRRRTRDPMFQNISDPKHRHAVLRIAGAAPDHGDPVVEALRAPKRGALLIYPVVEKELTPAQPGDEIKPSDVVIAFNLVAPQGARSPSGKLVQFVAHNSSASAPIVDRSVT